MISTITFSNDSNDINCKRNLNRYIYIYKDTFRNMLTFTVHVCSDCSDVQQIVRGCLGKIVGYSLNA